jgi:uncharacterized protein
MIKQVINKSARIKLKVILGASDAAIVGWLGESLKVRVPQAPEKGKANAAVEAIICKAINMPLGAAKIISGSTSQHKVIEIYGLSEIEVHALLSDYSATLKNL